MAEGAIPVPVQRVIRVLWFIRLEWIMLLSAPPLANDTEAKFMK